MKRKKLLATSEKGTENICVYKSICIAWRFQKKILSFSGFGCWYLGENVRKREYACSNVRGPFCATWMWRWRWRWARAERSLLYHNIIKVATSSYPFCCPSPPYILLRILSTCCSYDLVCNVAFFTISNHANFLVT